MDNYFYNDKIYQNTNELIELVEEQNTEIKELNNNIQNCNLSLTVISILVCVLLIKNIFNKAFRT